MTKKQILFYVVVAMVMAFAINSVAINAYARSAIYIKSVQFDGDCAKVKFERQGRSVVIRCLLYTYGSGRWNKVGEYAKGVSSGNYLQFCRLGTQRGKAKVIIKIMYNRIQQDQAGAMHR